MGNCVKLERMREILLYTVWEDIAVEDTEDLDKKQLTKGHLGCPLSTSSPTHWRCLRICMMKRQCWHKGRPMQSCTGGVPHKVALGITTSPLQGRKIFWLALNLRLLDFSPLEVWKTCRQLHKQHAAIKDTARNTHLNSRS